MADTHPIPNLEPRVAVLEQIARENERRFDGLDRRLDAIDRRLEAIESRRHSDFLTLLTIMLGGYAGMLGVMAHGFHWI